MKYKIRAVMLHEGEMWSRSFGRFDKPREAAFQIKRLRKRPNINYSVERIETRCECESQRTLYEPH